MTLEELNTERRQLAEMYRDVSAGIDEARNNLNRLIAQRDMCSGGIQAVDKLIAQEKADKEPMAAPQELADRAGT